MKKGLLFALACVTAMTVSSVSVKASDEIFDVDASGNVFGAGQTVDASKESKTIENEFYAAGMYVNANNVDINGSAFAAGESVTFNNTTVGGSIFAAGNTVTIDSVANNNIWAVGNIITLGADSSVKGLNVAGNTVEVNGSYKSANISGNSVVFNAEVEGDVKIEANSVTFGENAKIGGELVVKSSDDPKPSETVAESYEFEEVKEDNSSGSAISGKAKGIAGKAVIGTIILVKVKRVFFGLFKYALLAVILAFVFKNNLTKAYEYSKTKPGMFWGLGALTLVAFPIIAIIVAITVIGLPVAGLAVAFYALALVFAKVFTFASLVRELIFSRMGKRLNPVLEIVLAVLPAPILKEIPVVGAILSIACAIYMIGYVVLAFTDAISADK